MKVILSVRGASLLALAAATLVACKTSPQQPDPHAAARVSVAVGPVVFPEGADYSRSRLIAENRRTKVYTEFLAIEDPKDAKLLFPAAVAQEIGLTPAQVRRRFMDTVARSRRFEIYDITSTVTAEATDVVIDAKVTGVSQDLQPIEGGARVAVTRVRLSVQMKDRYTGKLLFPSGTVEVVGQTGRTTGDRAVIAPSERTDMPHVQRRTAQDYERALQRAFDEAAKRIDAVLRPMARVLSVDGNDVAIIGGSVHGLQGGDELVLIRATTSRVGETTVLVPTKAGGVVRCTGVGTETSLCTLIRRDASYQPQKDDFLVLSDLSAAAVRRD